MPLNIPLPPSNAEIPGGSMFNNMNAISKANLANRKQELENKYYGPKTNAEIQQALAQSGLLGSEQKKNEFQVANPQYMNPEGFLYSQAMKEQQTQQQVPQQGGLQGTPYSPTPAPPAPPTPGNYQEYGAVNKASPEEVNAIANNGNNALGKPNNSMSNLPINPNAGPFSQLMMQKLQGADYKGLETTKINNANDIKDLNDTYFSAQTNQTNLDNIADMLGSPEFEQIRQIPLAGRHELAYYAKEGTPEQQNMIGQYYTSIGNLIKDASKDFKGQFRQGEQTLLEGMKPNSADTVDTARGKMEALSYMNRMLMERSKITSQLMSQYKINKLDASKIADEQVKGKEIRKDIHDRLNPTITIRNKRTGQEETVSIAEARKRGIQNV